MSVEQEIDPNFEHNLRHEHQFTISGGNKTNSFVANQIFYILIMMVLI